MKNTLLVLIVLLNTSSIILACSWSPPPRIGLPENQCGKCLDCPPKGLEHIYNPIMTPGSTLEKWPWMVSFGYEIDVQGSGNGLTNTGKTSKTWKAECGGVIVNKRTILSAAHCFRRGHKDIRTGDEAFNDEQDSTTAHHTINTIITHPNYVGGPFFDIAVVFTAEDIEFNERTRPICLPQSEKAKNDMEGDSVYLAGWGKEADPEWENFELLYTKLTILPNEFCHEHFYPFLDSIFICAGDERGLAGSCPGDSGGPLMKFDYETFSYKVVGVLHGSSDDCSVDDDVLDKPGLYARLEDPEVFSFLQKALTYIDKAQYNAMYGYVDEIVSFHSSMTNPNPVVTRDGLTILHIAAEHNQYYIVKEFLEKLDLKALPLTDNQGQTPLHRAASKGHWYIVDLWKQSGLDMHAKDNNGDTPLNLAERNGHSSILNLFQ